MKNSTLINRFNRLAQTRLGQTSQRFPVTLLLLAGLAAKVFVDGFARINVPNPWEPILSTPTPFDLSEVAPGMAYVFLLGGILISAAAALWLENRLRFWKLHASVAAVTLVWGAYCWLGKPIMSGEFFWGQSFREALGAVIAHDEYITPKLFRLDYLEALLVAAGAALLAFAPFLRKGRDAAFSTFFSRVALVVVLSYLASLVLKLAFLPIYYGFHKVVGYPEFVIAIAIVFLWVLFFPVCVLMYIPDKRAKYRDSEAPKWGNWLFGLCAGAFAYAYAAVLYVSYAAYWTDGSSQGDTTGAILGLAFAGLFAIMLISPLRRSGECPCGEDWSECPYWFPATHVSRALAWASRWFGAVMLPLLIMMSANIVSEVKDYGFTLQNAWLPLHSVWLLLINLWLYGIYAYLFITKARNVKWIPASLGILLIASSVGPWRVSNVTRHVLVAGITKYMDDPQLYVGYASARDALYGELNAAAWSDNRMVDVRDALRRYMSLDNYSELMRSNNANYLLAAYNWKGYGAYVHADEPDSYAAGDFMIRPAGKRNAVMIAGYTGSDTALCIPPKLDGKNVTIIGDDAFAGKGLTSVALPKSVTSIGARAFMRNRLTGVAIPPKVSAIGAEAFLDNELERVAIPRGVATIGERAFAYNRLSGITLPRRGKFVAEDAFVGND